MPSDWREAGVPVRWPTTNWAVLIVLAVYVSVVGTLMYGPQPRRFTKWAAFWWASLPLGLGLIWLLTREAPWSRTATALPEPLPHSRQKQTPEGDSRLTGGWTFLITFGVGTFANLVVALIWV